MSQFDRDEIMGSSGKDLTTVAALHPVPTKDATADVNMRDVVGKKDDTAVTAVGTTKSIVAYIKGILATVIKVPQSDGTVSFNSTALGAIEAECVDAIEDRDLDHLNKVGAGSGAYPTNVLAESILAHIMAISGTITDYDNATMSLEALRAAIDSISTTSATTTGVIVQDGATGTPNNVAVATHADANTFGNWVELDAAVSADSWINQINCKLELATENIVCFEIGTGAAASEAAKIRYSYFNATSGSNDYGDSNFITLPIPIKVASGVRIAARASKSDTTAKNLHIALSMYQGLEI